MTHIAQSIWEASCGIFQGEIFHRWEQPCKRLTMRCGTAGNMRSMVRILFTEDLHGSCKASGLRVQPLGFCTCRILAFYTPLILNAATIE
jgi:hypothetical protein